MADIRTLTVEGTTYNIKDSTARADITTLQTNVTTLQTNVTTLQTNVTTLQTNVTQLQTNTDDLPLIRENVENNTDDIRDLKSAIEQKANANGTYENLTAGNILSSQYAEDSTPYLFRASGGGVDVGSREYDTIVGGTVAFNQQVHNGNFVNSEYVNTSTTATLTISDNTATMLASARYGQLRLNAISIISSHKYLLLAAIKGTTAISGTFTIYLSSSVYFKNPVITDSWQNYSSIINYAGTSSTSLSLLFQDGRTSDWDSVSLRNVMLFDLTQMFGTSIADYIYNLEQSTAGAGVAWFKKLFPADYYGYNSGTLESVQGLVSHDMVGFNQFDKSTAVSGQINAQGEVTTSTSRKTSAFIRVISGSDYYVQNLISTRDGRTAFAYDANKNPLRTLSISGNVSATSGIIHINNNEHYIRVAMENAFIDSACINLSQSGTRNGEYEPYEKYSYPLDSSIVLRGVPKLSADNKLYYDGDIYTYDGKIQRRYGIVDLGTVSWSYFIQNDIRFFYYRNNTIANFGGNIGIVCSKYPYVGRKSTSGMMEKDKVIASFGGGGNPAEIRIADSAYTSVGEFKTAMSGIMLVYELETPTEETATPYAEIQKVDAYGTEEYVVSNSIVPVGHNTKYPVDLKAKLEGLPDNFSTLIAPTETTTTASRAYTVGSYLILNNTLYRVTSAIANGATITPGTNVTATTIMSEIMAMA